MKKEIYCVVLAAGVVLTGIIPGMQTRAKEDNVVVAQKMTETADYYFAADSSIAPFTINRGDCLAVIQQAFDYEAAVEAIESGAIAPLALDNLPVEADVDSAFAFTDEDGTENIVSLSETSVYSNCAHKYDAGVVTIHDKYADGSCVTVSYDGMRCGKCNTIWLLDVIGSSSYRVCPH